MHGFISSPSQVGLLRSAGEVPEAIGGPLRAKYFMYIVFLLLVLCNVVLEITLHALLNNYGKMWVVLTVYEICDLVICGLIFFVFRPRDHSPFFFMVPATLNDTRTRPIPIIEADDWEGESSELAEIEIAPLLGVQRGNSNINNSNNSSNNGNNDKMVIVRNPGGDVMVGMSPVMQTRSHHGGSGPRDPQRGMGYVPSSARSGGDVTFERRFLPGVAQRSTSSASFVSRSHRRLDLHGGSSSSMRSDDDLPRNHFGRESHDDGSMRDTGRQPTSTVQMRNLNSY